MPNILLTRIDNRLIHGQVGVTWANHLGANLIVVANDKVAVDDVQQNLMDMAVSDVVETRYFTIRETIDKIHYAAEDQMIFLVVKNPQDVVRLVEGKVPITKLNIGNMHFCEGKQQITSTVSVDEEDRQAFRRLQQLAVKMEIRRVPDEGGIDISKFL
jgi:PTS system N-acetylgalactosamine-specific IIB component